MYNLNNLKLIGRGGQADIYELDNNKVLRVIRNPKDEKHLLTEMTVLKSLKEKGKSVPTVYEFIKIDKKPAIIMERLYGETMLTDIQRKPFSLLKQAEKLATYQMEVDNSAEELNLLSIKKRAHYLISNTELLTDEMKKFILTILDDLPEGNDICHGDFHPGNIILSKNNYFIIDWFGATSGRKLSDIAHTYLLLKNTPKIPGMPNIQYMITKLFGKILSKKYITTINKLDPFSFNEFSKWLLVKAAERVVYGLPSEKDTLIKFINKCMLQYNYGLSYDEYWKLI